MGSVLAYTTARGERRYEVYYRDDQHVAHHKRGFRTKKEARTYLAVNEVAVENGTYVDPSAGRVTISVIGAKWIEGHKAIWKPSYLRSVETAWKIHVEPQWGARSLKSIRHSEIQTWVSIMAQRRSATVVLRAYGIMKGIYDMATEDRLIANVPTSKIQLPRKKPRGRVSLTPRQLLDLADASGRYRALILLLGFCGLRWGEATGLLVRDVDFENRRIRIGRSATWVGSEVRTGTPKSNTPRQVGMPNLVADALRRQAEGKDPDDLLFPSESGGYLRQQSAAKGHRGWFATAVERSGVPSLRIHDLRHTAASIAISSGASPKYVQRMLGHKYASTTLDTYADLYDSDVDRVAESVDRFIAKSVS